jgi:hypothetical protein
MAPRGGRGLRGGGRIGRGFARGHGRGNDPYAKAASEEMDQLLAKKLKSICRGC